MLSIPDSLLWQELFVSARMVPLVSGNAGGGLRREKALNGKGVSWMIVSQNVIEGKYYGYGKGTL